MHRWGSTSIFTCRCSHPALHARQHFRANAERQTVITALLACLIVFTVSFQAMFTTVPVRTAKALLDLLWGLLNRLRRAGSGAAESSGQARGQKLCFHGLSFFLPDISLIAAAAERICVAWLAFSACRFALESAQAVCCYAIVVSCNVHKQS
eukprot:scaffold366019_cov36-Prasinocladus_malaysianus.AAC.1